MPYQNIREEELKNKIGQDFFADFDTTKIIGNVDFCVAPKDRNQNQNSLFETHSLLWAEAKQGDYDTMVMITQLVLTIGKARTFDKFLPPAFLGAFDYYKIGFIPYSAISEIFTLNDFNWNVAPSNHNTKEFAIIKDKIQKSLANKHYIYNFDTDQEELRFFIKTNIAGATELGKIQIDKNNFVPIYLRWLKEVKPYIDFDFTKDKKGGIVDTDFYLADLFVDDQDTAIMGDDTPVNENLFVVFKESRYEIAKENLKQLYDASIKFRDKSKYEQFWKRYKRPPQSEIQKFILLRKDLLVPQDIRERKGAFFTPQKWVELSQKYLAEVLGKDWQEEYYIWDCCAGTGNLLAGLINKYNIWASTLDQPDVNIMYDRIENGANLLKSHVFQFDFLNDGFSKLPQGLQDIVSDPEKRKKLVIYINPPYAEATSATTVTGTGKNKEGVATNHKPNELYKPLIGNASNEIFALFMARIYDKIGGAKLAQFSTLKFLNSTNFNKFRNFFLAKYLNGFIVPANTFDNVKGSFPIGFTIWDTSIKVKIDQTQTDVYDKDSELIGKKSFYGELSDSINKWIKLFDDKKNISIGFMGNPAPDFQHNSQLYISEKKGIEHFNFWKFNANNLIFGSIYLAVRHCIDATWLNDRDQFLYPNDGWKDDTEFQNDCLTFTLFHSQNRISSREGSNHWIPFTEAEVDARDKFASNFMTDFLAGKIDKLETKESVTDVFDEPVKVDKNQTPQPLEFSDTAKAVFDSGRGLWRYYHQTAGKKTAEDGDYNVNSSLYDIREYFQGRKQGGKDGLVGRMNNKSEDEKYNLLIANLRTSLKIIAKKIEPKVYAYGFLKA